MTAIALIHAQGDTECHHMDNCNSPDDERRSALFRKDETFVGIPLMKVHYAAGTSICVD